MAADYLMTADLLITHGISRPVAEIHGVICGQLSADSTAYDSSLSLDILEIKEDVDIVITNLLTMLAEDISKQILAQDYTFQPLLPDDEEDLTQRLTALALWCDGYNAGFSGACVSEEAGMFVETQEVLSDFSRISQVDNSDATDGDKENEVNYMEIVEFVRMGAITVFLQNSSSQPAAIDMVGVSRDEPIH